MERMGKREKEVYMYSLPPHAESSSHCPLLTTRFNITTLGTGDSGASL